VFGQKELWDGVVLDLNNDIFGPENVILRTLLFFGERVVPGPPRRNSLSRMIHERIQGRGPRPDSENLGWRTEGFRGYADFMAGHMRRKSLIQRLVKAGIWNEK